MYEAVKTKLKEAGELMVWMDSGVEHELHLHNVTFNDEDHVFKIDAADEIHWIDGDAIERYWLHKDF